MEDSFSRFINTMTSKAIEDCFSDTVVYGTGYLKVIYYNQSFRIEHIPFSEVDKELTGFVELKKLIYSGKPGD